jgi:hypothetical protein
MPLCSSTGVASRGESKAALLRAWLDAHHPERIGDAEVESVRAALGRVSDGYLRRLLRRSDVPLHPLVEGVAQENLDSLARTLLALREEYEGADLRTRRRIREIVIEAKQHCAWALRRLGDDDARRDGKREALLWMNTWLENPPIFDHWLAARQRSNTTRPDPER